MDLSLNGKVLTPRGSNIGTGTVDFFRNYMENATTANNTITLNNQAWPTTTTYTCASTIAPSDKLVISKQ